MSSIKNNQAAWITSPKANPMKIGPGPTPNPDSDEVVIKVFYAAVNPTDWKMQDNPYMQVPYPYIFGCDVAGTIVQLGSAVTRFKIGQRVIGHCDSLLSGKSTNAGFQTYTTVNQILTSPIPSSLPLANAAVLPLSISTAATGLFENLALPFPTLTPTQTGKTILIWGGSSSVGSTAIQLAVAAGLSVATTASVAHSEYVKSLGAKYVFDYKSKTVVKEILEVMKEGDVVFDCIGSTPVQVVCGEVLGKIGGGTLPTVNWPVGPFPDNVHATLVLPTVNWPTGPKHPLIPAAFNTLAAGTKAVDVGGAVWGKFIPEALKAGKFQTKPDPMVLEGGLERVQEGINLLRKGISAKKIVIEISKE